MSILMLGSEGLAAEVKIINLEVKSLAYDTNAHLLYVSSTTQLIPVDPFTGEQMAALDVGGPPEEIALSSDMRWLYLLTDRGDWLRRYDLESSKVDQSSKIDSNTGQFIRRARHLLPIPGQPEAVALGLFYPCCTPHSGGFVVYEGGELLPKAAFGPLGNGAGNSIAVNYEGSKLYSYDNESTERSFIVMSLGRDGVELDSQLLGVLSDDPFANLVGGKGSIFTTSGFVLSEPDLKLRKRIEAGTTFVEVSAGRVFVVSGAEPQYQISSFDTSTLNLLQTINVQRTVGPPGQALVRFGSMGLALGSVNQLILVQERLILAPSETQFMRGDSNSDGRVDIADAIWSLSALFRAGPLPSCEKAADANGDDRFDLTDALYGLEYVLGAGASPRAPFPACGLDDRPGALSCDGDTACP